jgi:hypothetical protein
MLVSGQLYATAALLTRERVRVTDWIGELVGSRGDVDMVANWNVTAPVGNEPRSPIRSQSFYVLSKKV